MRIRLDLIHLHLDLIGFIVLFFLPIQVVVFPLLLVILLELLLGQEVV